VALMNRSEGMIPSWVLLIKSIVTCSTT